MATETGKIGRLSHELRNEINRMIRDNRTAEQILKFLRLKGVKGISPQNISTWKTHGHQKWLRGQDRIEEMQTRLEFARNLVERAKADGGDAMTVASDTAAQLVTDNILAMLEEFKPETMQGLLAEKPEKFIDVIFALAAMRKGDQAAVILRQKVEEYRRRLKQLETLVDEKGVATKDDLKSIFQESYGA